MTGGSSKLVGKIIRPVGVGYSTMEVSVSVVTGGFIGFLVRNPRTGELVVPMGGTLDLVAANNPPIMGAFPARLGTANRQWLNCYHRCGVTELSAMPPADGLREAMPAQHVSIDGWREVGHPPIPFVAAAGGVVFNNVIYDRIEIGYRYPSNPNDIPGLAPGSGRKGDDDSNDGGSRGYGVAHSFGVLRLVPRTVVVRWLAEDGIVLNPGTDYDWSAAKLRTIGLEAEDIDLGGLVTA